MLNSYFSALKAPLQGAWLCLENRELRKLSLWPWVSGINAWFGSAIIFFYAHPRLVDFLSYESDWAMAKVWNFMAEVFAGAGLLALTFLVSFAFVLIFSSFVQTSIARTVLELRGVSLPKESTGLKQAGIETSRTILSEAFKLLWLVPLMLLLFLCGFFPVVAPLALTLTAWLLAYQFVDIVLDTMQVRADRRLKFCLRHFLKLAGFGGVLAVCWAVPLVGVLLAPGATAAAALLLVETGLAEEILANTPKEA